MLNRIFSGFLIGFFLFVCGNYANAQDKVVTIWLWNINKPPVDAAARKFEKTHPGVKINVLLVGNLASRDKISTGLMARGKGLPDISLVEDDFFSSFVDLYPSQFVNLSKMGYDKYRTSFPKYKIEGVSYKDSIYAFPFDAGPVIVFYRRSVFKKAGVDPESIKTWDDYLAAGLKVKEATGKFMFGASNDDGIYRNIMGQWGIGYYDKDGNIDLNHPRSVEALSIVKKMMDAGIVHKRAPGWDSWLRDMSSGTIVAIPAGAWLEGSIESSAPDTKGDWGVFKLPINEGQVAGASQGGSSFVLFKSSKNKQLAYDFMEYFTTDVGNQTVAFKGGLFPTYNKVYDTEAFKAPVEFFGNQAVWSVAASTINDIRTVNRTADYNYARLEAVKAFQKVLLESNDVVKSLSEAAEAVKKRTGRKINKY